MFAPVFRGERALGVAPNPPPGVPKRDPPLAADVAQEAPKAAELCPNPPAALLWPKVPPKGDWNPPELACGWPDVGVEKLKGADAAGALKPPKGLGAAPDWGVPRLPPKPGEPNAEDAAAALDWPNVPKVPNPGDDCCSTNSTSATVQHVVGNDDDYCSRMGG